VSTATLVVDDGVVVYAGPESSAPLDVDEGVDLDGRCVMPGFVDSHAHLVFAGDRADEFALRMAGRPYQPGGILETVAATRSATTAALEVNARRLIGEARAAGTTTSRSRPDTGSPPNTRPPTSGSPDHSRPRPPSSAPTWSRPSTPATATATSGS
jgi:imidazolonepropionase